LAGCLAQLVTKRQKMTYNQCSSIEDFREIVVISLGFDKFCFEVSLNYFEDLFIV